MPCIERTLVLACLVAVGAGGCTDAAVSWEQSAEVLRQVGGEVKAERGADAPGGMAVSLVGKRFNERIIAAIIQIPNIVSLDVSMSDIDDVVLARIVAHQPHIQRLYLDSCRAVRDADRHINRLERLLTLDLLGSRIELRSLDGQTWLSTLQELRYGRSEWTVEEERVLLQMRRLRRLELHTCEMIAGTCAKLQQLQCLEAIEIRGATFDDETFASLGRLPKLRELNVAVQPITERGFRGLSGSPVRRLVLRTNKMNDETCAALAGLPQLEQLELEHVAMRKEGLEHLQRNRRLHTLKLYLVDATDDWVDVFVGIENLKHLELAITSLSEEGVARLRKSRPDLCVVWTPRYR